MNTVEPMPINSARVNIVEPMAGDNDLYYIANGNGEYWAYDMGWVDYESADQYTGFETRIMNLPMGGHWVKA